MPAPASRSLYKAKSLIIEDLALYQSLTVRGLQLIARSLGVLKYFSFDCFETNSFSHFESAVLITIC